MHKYRFGNARLGSKTTEKDLEIIPGEKRLTAYWIVLTGVLPANQGNIFFILFSTDKASPRRGRGWMRHGGDLITILKYMKAIIRGR